MSASAELAGAAHRVDSGLPARLAALLAVPEGGRLSELERLRRAPRRSSGPEMVKALQRAEQISALGAGQVDLEDIPANRMQVLARSGLGSKASALARLREPKRTATLVAVVQRLEAAAVDDALDLFALLMTTRLFSPARRASAEQRLATLPRLERASKTVARAGHALLDALAAADDGHDQVDVDALWAAVEGVAPRAVVLEAIAVVEELVPEQDGAADTAMRVALAGLLQHRPPIPHSARESSALRAAPTGERVLAAVPCVANPNGFFDSPGRLVDVCVLPYADDGPPAALQCLVCVAVSLDVCLELGGPPLDVRLGNGAVDGAAVPEATVDEDGDLGFGEDQVCGAADLGNGSSVDSVAQAAAVELASEHQFWFGVACGLARHSDSGGFG